jgi:hypothetical protein
LNGNIHDKIRLLYDKANEYMIRNNLKSDSVNNTKSIITDTRSITRNNEENVSTLSSLPPKVPSIPGILGVPSISGVPSIPGKGVAGVPGVPGIPSIPGLPGKSVPGVPGIPSISIKGVPVAPGGVPGIPGGVPKLVTVQPLPVEILPKPPKDTVPKKLYWQQLPKNKVAESFWSKKKLEAKCDYENLCKYFCEVKKKESKIEEKSSNPQTTVQVIKILDDKRLMNLGIVLSKVTFTNEELKNLIENFKDTIISLDMLDKIIQMIPNQEECEKLRAYTGDISLLSHGEKFCLIIMSIKHYVNKLQFIKYKKIIDAEKTEISGRLKSLREA